MRCVPAVDKCKLSPEQQIGVNIVRRSLEEPIRQISENAGVEGSVVVDKIRRENKPSYGFNAANEEYVDMIDSGIIDPTKVTRCALQNAASVAGLMLTTEVMITDIPEEKKDAAPGAGGMGGHGGHMHDMY